MTKPANIRPEPQPPEAAPTTTPKGKIAMLLGLLRQPEGATIDAMMAATAGPSDLRVVLPQRLQLRGGRTAIRGAANERQRAINPGLVNALKRAHADLVALNASPFTASKDLIGAAAPATQHDRQVCRLALMSPELQRQILTGDQPVGLALRQVLKSPMPLAWADQKAWLKTISRA